MSTASTTPILTSSAAPAAPTASTTPILTSSAAPAAPTTSVEPTVPSVLFPTPYDFISKLNPHQSYNTIGTKYNQIVENLTTINKLKLEKGHNTMISYIAYHFIDFIVVIYYAAFLYDLIERKLVTPTTINPTYNKAGLLNELVNLGFDCVTLRSDNRDNVPVKQCSSGINSICSGKKCCLLAPYIRGIKLAAYVNAFLSEPSIKKYMESQNYVSSIYWYNTLPFYGFSTSHSRYIKENIHTLHDFNKTNSDISYLQDILVKIYDDIFANPIETLVKDLINHFPNYKSALNDLILKLRETIDDKKDEKEAIKLTSDTDTIDIVKEINADDHYKNRIGKNINFAEIKIQDLYNDRILGYTELNKSVTTLSVTTDTNKEFNEVIGIIYNHCNNLETTIENLFVPSLKLTFDNAVKIHDFVSKNIPSMNELKTCFYTTNNTACITEIHKNILLLIVIAPNVWTDDISPISTSGALNDERNILSLDMDKYVNAISNIFINLIGDTDLEKCKHKMVWILFAIDYVYNCVNMLYRWVTSVKGIKLCFLNHVAHKYVDIIELVTKKTGASAGSTVSHISTDSDVHKTIKSEIINAVIHGMHTELKKIIDNKLDEQAKQKEARKHHLLDELTERVQHISPYGSPRHDHHHQHGSVFGPH